MKNFHVSTDERNPCCATARIHGLNKNCPPGDGVSPAQNQPEEKTKAAQTDGVALNMVTLHVVILFVQGELANTNYFIWCAATSPVKRQAEQRGYPRSTKQNKQKKMSAIGSASRYP